MEKTIGERSLVPTRITDDDEGREGFGGDAKQVRRSLARLPQLLIPSLIWNE
jgi:hypothetical protein